MLLLIFLLGWLLVNSRSRRRANSTGHTARPAKELHYHLVFLVIVTLAAYQMIYGNGFF